MQGKRVFIKDIDHYLLPPAGKPASVAPSLRRIKRGVGTTNGDAHAPANGVNGAANGTTHANGHATVPTNGVANGTSNGVNGSNGTVSNRVTNGVANGVHEANGHGTNGVSHRPYPYDTPAEAGNPTVMPREIQERFHFAFLIRDPHFSVPSYYRCTIPPLDEVTGFHNYDPREAGYDELRRHFDYLVREGLVGPRVATRPDVKVENCGAKQTVHEICVIDADDMLDAPAATIEAFCKSVNVPYDASLLTWDTQEDYDFACHCFEKWRGFHNDAIESKALVARAHVSIPQTLVVDDRVMVDNLVLTWPYRNVPARPRKSLMPNGPRSMVPKQQLLSARPSTRTWRTTCT